MIVDALIPAERTRGIDYHKEREALISSHAAALEEKVGELEKQIRERERIEEVLRKAEARHRTLLTVTPDPIVALDFNGSVTYINPAFEKTYGWSREEVLGQRTRGWTGGEAPMERIEFIPEHEDQKTWDALKRNFKGENVSLETQRFTKDGRLLDIHLNTAVFDLESDNPGVIVIHRDISKRKRAEKDLRRLRNLMKEIIDSMPSMLVGVDPEGRVTQWNREAEKATGVTAKEARGWLLKEAFPGLSGQMSHVRRAIRERAPVKDAKAPHQVDGEIRYWDVTVYPLVSNDVEGAVIRVDDVTERARIDEMIVQTEKMVSVGGLAAGMAHEINNPLAGVLQNVQVIRNRVAGDLPKNRRTAEACGVSMDIIKTYMDRRGIPETIDTVMESGHRAAVIVDNMLSFSRKSASDFIPHRVPELLDKTLKLAENDYSLKSKFDFREIRIVREYAPSLPKVPCEGSKIQQVFLNLLKNGAQAMAANRERKTPPGFILRVLPEGDQVRVEIEDNGPGIDEAVRKRVFEPFFTTKEVGVGTGLGLSVSYFIITENHKGAISVESTPGEGAKFIIHLPVNRPADNATPPVGSLR
ncbi:MAG: PAS domain S-box protein [Desulfobacterales bacterium]|nr:PAS domain S-box protein [Desulfobacterales bacterium]